MLQVNAMILLERPQRQLTGIIPGVAPGGRRESFVKPLVHFSSSPFAESRDAYRGISNPSSYKRTKT